MSKKDVLHIPPEAFPTAPDRSADSDGEAPQVPPMRPFEGPGGTPSESGHPRIITPQPAHDPYPGTHVH